MTRDKLQFRRELLDCESIDAALRRKFQTEVQAMWERKLSSPRRAWFKMLAIIMLAMGIFFGCMAYLAPATLPPVARIAFVVGAVFCLASVFVIWQLARRGVMNLRTDPMRMAALGWAFVVMMVVVFMVISGMHPDSTRGLMLVINGIVFMIGAGLILIRTVIEQSELRTREKLLEIEYRLEQLTDEIKRRDGGDDQFEPARV
jgi:hypothetical protein